MFYVMKNTQEGPNLWLELIQGIPLFFVTYLYLVLVFLLAISKWHSVSHGQRQELLMFVSYKKPPGFNPGCLPCFQFHCYSKITWEKTNLEEEKGGYFSLQL